MSTEPMLSWRSGKARIWGTEGPRFEPHSSHPSEVPAAVDPWANRGSLKDAGIAQIRAVSRGDRRKRRRMWNSSEKGWKDLGNLVYKL
ncbi:hypothetical protein E3N88_10656 [Mikania micrantha]|uniref:Uncharacterized protein n=1 Tax=Mikania micrantha TaxID=192012 RepID=A0A5N6PBD0_9ASTR|nr:hypothetical protein E3N88_10656 [Mikania micrantha]